MVGVRGENDDDKARAHKPERVMTINPTSLRNQNTHTLHDGNTYPSTALVAAATAAGPSVPPRSKADLPPVVLLMTSAVVRTKHETTTTPTAMRTHHRRRRLLASSFWWRMVGWSSKSGTPAPAPPAAKEESEVKMLSVSPCPPVALPVASWVAW